MKRGTFAVHFGSLGSCEDSKVINEFVAQTRAAAFYYFNTIKIKLHFFLQCLFVICQKKLLHIKKNIQNLHKWLFEQNGFSKIQLDPKIEDYEYLTLVLISNSACKANNEP